MRLVKGGMEQESHQKEIPAGRLHCAALIGQRALPCSNCLRRAAAIGRPCGLVDENGDLLKRQSCYYRCPAAVNIT